MSPLRLTVLALATLSLGAHCDEPCPPTAEHEDFAVRDDHAIGAQLLLLNVSVAGGITSAEIAVTADRPVVVAQVRSTVPAEVRASVADPEAIGFYRVLSTQDGRGTGRFVVNDATRLAGYNALLIAPLGPKSDAPYSLNVSVRQYPGDNPIHRGEHGQCRQLRRPPLPDRFVPALRLPAERSGGE